MQQAMPVPTSLCIDVFYEFLLLHSAHVHTVHPYFYVQKAGISQEYIVYVLPLYCADIRLSWGHIAREELYYSRLYV